MTRDKIPSPLKRCFSLILATFVDVADVSDVEKPFCWQP
jgi:hypothetical protein